MVLPPDFTKKQLYSVSKSQGLIKYSLDAVNGLHDISVNAYSPIPSGALILATATAGSEERHYIVRGQDGRQHDVTVHAGEHLSYLLRFDGNGAFRAAVPIDNGIRLSRVAMFTSGTYVGIGTTRSDSSLHLMLLDENGTLSRLLDPPDELADIARKGMHSLHGAAGATPWVQFVPGPEKILMVPLHSRGTVFEIRPGGEITALKLKLPKGLVVGALVPATDHLYAWIASANDGDDLESARLYEFDQNGSIVRELEPIGASPGEIACKQDGSFVAFRLDNDAKLIALKAGD